MAQTMVNFRMDEDLKKKMEKVCADMGMSMTYEHLLFLQKLLREKKGFRLKLQQIRFIQTAIWLICIGEYRR